MAKILYHFIYMVITYHGGGCFKITSGSNTILTDPESNRFKGDIVLKTSQNLPLPARSNEIIGPGEYEIKGVAITGYALPDSDQKTLKTAYVVDVEEMKLCFLGEVSKLPEAEVLKEMNCDIVFLAPTAAKALKQLNAKMAVAAFFKNAKQVSDAFDQKISQRDKLTIKKKDLPTTTEVVVLKHD